VICNAVIHLLSEQPILADLYEAPKAVDQGLLCTNIRTMDGRKPIFVDRSDSMFFFPYLHIRFIESVPASTATARPPAGAATASKQHDEASDPAQAAPGADTDADTDLELDEDFLRRIREV
jgi:hypothetical protein